MSTPQIIILISVILIFLNFISKKSIPHNEPKNLEDIRNFIDNYKADDFINLDYTTIEDEEKISFRDQVMEVVLSEKGEPPISLISDLFRIEARYTFDIWGGRSFLSKIGSAMLNRGGLAELNCFLASYNLSDDTFHGLKEMELEETKRQFFIDELLRMSEETRDPDEKYRLEGAAHVLQCCPIIT